MTRRRAAIAGLAVVLVAGAALVLAGRGTSAKDRWKQAAGAACDTRAHAVEVASAQLTAQSTPEQFAQFFTRFFEPAYRSQLDAQRRAGPPDDDARALVADTAAVLDAMAADPGSFAVAADPFGDVDARWDAYGLRACGSRTDGSVTLSSTVDDGGGSSVGS